MSQPVGESEHMGARKTPSVEPEDGPDSRSEPEGPSGELVSESELPEDVEDQSEANVDRELLATNLVAKLTADGFDVESPGPDVVFQLPAGRSHRLVQIRSSEMEAALSLELRGWRSLERYDGIWNKEAGIVEVQLRSDRLVPGVHVLRRLSHFPFGAEPEPVRFVDDSTGTEVQIGRGSEIMALLSGQKRRFGSFDGRQRALGPLTLTASRLIVDSVLEADNFLQRLTDALAVEVGMRFGLVLVPVGLTVLDRNRVKSRHPGGKMTFPRSQFPHAPVVLYIAGRERTTSALLRYWAFYQVLEYFFPYHTRAASLQRMARILRSPTFDAFRDDDLMRATAAAAEVGNSRVSEQDQLITCMRAITTNDELRDLIERQDLASLLEDKRNGISDKIVKVAGASDVVSDLAKRVYDVRCRIVHSKSDSDREGGHGLLPGTNDEFLVETELPILEFLAEQALIASASKFNLEPNPNLSPVARKSL